MDTERFQQFIENIEGHFFFYSYDLQGAFTYVSPSIEKILGYSPEEFLQHYQTYFTDNRMSQQVEKYSLKSTAGHSHPSYFVEILHKDKSIRILEMIEKPVFDKEGAIRRVDGVGRDVTQQKESEHIHQRTGNLLQKSFQQLMAIFDCIEEIIYVVDVTTHEVIYSNKAARLKWGDLIKKKCFKVLQNIDHPCDHCSSADEDSVVESWECYNSALQKWYRCSAKLIPWTDREKVRFEMAKDITALKKNQDEIVYQRNEQAVLLDTVPAMIFYKDTQNRFIRVNQALADVMGVSKEELEGKSLFDLYPQEAAQKYWQDDQQVIATGKPKRSIVETMEVSGKETRWVQTDKIPYRDEEGNVVGVIGISVDITDRQRAEEYLMKMNQELEQLNQLKTGFISTVSHELRTPLCITREGISIVLDKILGEINPEQQKTLATAKENIDRLSRIINDILDISKIEAGRMEFNKTKTNVSSIIENVFHSFQPRMAQKGLRFEIDLPKEEMLIYGDIDRLNQVFINLVANAYKYTQQGAIVIRVRPAGDSIECTVEDTGCGIEEKDIEKVFDSFQQFGRVPGAGDRGTGLGLSIAKEIIELHEGTITVSSTKEKGSCFTVKLPQYSEKSILRQETHIFLKERDRLRQMATLVLFSIKAIPGVEQISSVETVMSIACKVIKNTLRRRSDRLIHYGQELVVLLVDTPREGALAVVGRCRHLVEDLKIKGFELQIGLAEYPQQGIDAKQIIEFARQNIV